MFANERDTGTGFVSDNDVTDAYESEREAPTPKKSALERQITAHKIR